MLLVLFILLITIYIWVKIKKEGNIAEIEISLLCLFTIVLLLQSTIIFSENLHYLRLSKKWPAVISFSLVEFMTIPLFFVYFLRVKKGHAHILIMVILCLGGQFLFHYMAIFTLKEGIILESIFYWILFIVLFKGWAKLIERILKKELKNSA
ncbi:MAG: hypothetical protein ABF649_02770 [Bacillus sp. (in: firmicutes)]